MFYGSALSSFERQRAQFHSEPLERQTQLPRDCGCVGTVGFGVCREVRRSQCDAGAHDAVCAGLAARARRRRGLVKLRDGSALRGMFSHRYARAGHRSRFQAGSNKCRSVNRSRTRPFIRRSMSCRAGNCARKSLASCVRAASCAAPAPLAGTGAAASSAWCRSTSVLTMS